MQVFRRCRRSSFSLIPSLRDGELRRSSRSTTQPVQPFTSLAGYPCRRYHGVLLLLLLLLLLEEDEEDEEEEEGAKEEEDEDGPSDDELPLDAMAAMVSTHSTD